MGVPAGVLLLLLVTVGHGAAMEDYRLKAAFVLNFARYTLWPGESFQGEGDPLVLCVSGNSAVRAAFRGVDGKSVGKRILKVRFAGGADGCRGGHMIFISRETGDSDLSRLLDTAAGRPVLTIGEKFDFVRAGGIMTFIEKNGRLSFEVNWKRAVGKNLDFSSRLLKLAVIVEGEEK